MLFQTMFAQTKEIKGDTAYWYKRNVEFQKTLGLKNFEKSQDEFIFRFWNHGQVIEISKDSSEINGLIVNYITAGAQEKNYVAGFISYMILCCMIILLNFLTMSQLTPYL